ncbi:MAG: hypothetical protein KAT68_03570 [Bacteroidales bacterium]|nr:hypothetical protein [Bacteroidales bacterium]
MKKKAFIIFCIVLPFIIFSCNDDDDNIYKSIEGTWIVEEHNSVTGMSNYQAYIDIGDNEPPVLYIQIDNFHNLGVDKVVYAGMEGNKITIGQQIVFGSGESVNGNGEISSDKKNINWDYEVDDGSGETEYVTAYYKRK